MTKIIPFKTQSLYSPDWVFDGMICQTTRRPRARSFKVKFRDAVDITHLLTETERKECRGEFVLMYELANEDVSCERMPVDAFQFIGSEA